MSLPLDLRLALAPLDTYRQLITAPARGTWVRAFERPALIAVIIGVAVTMSSAGTVPFGLIVMGIVLWSFVPIVQLLIGTIVIGQARGRPMSLPRCLELLFIGHLPWSLWTLVMIGLFTFTPLPIGVAIRGLSLLIPGVWTTMIVFAFCRTALGCTPRRARILTAAHQVMTWTAFFTYVFLVSGIWSRLLALVGA
jgi:hypothetical protein